MKRLITAALTLILLAACPSALLAQAGTSFTYQGSLVQNGVPASGPHNLEFRLWSSAAGGSQVGATVVMNGHPVTDGLLSVELDFGANAFDNSGRWLEAKVNGVTLAPRTAITRAPYSLQTRGLFVGDNLRVGIGTTTPLALLHSRSADNVIYAELLGNTSDTSAILGNASNGGGVTYGVLGRARSISGTGVYGVASSSTGVTYGVRGDCSSASGFAGYFAGRGHFRDPVGFGTTSPQYPVDARLSNGTAIYGEGRYGVQGTAVQPGGRGVFGFGASLDGETDGVFGITASSAGRGVFGQATSSAGITSGVRGEVASPSGSGVHGLASSAMGASTGVRGVAVSPDGRGVVGEATSTSGSTFGVVGTTASPVGYGVYGYATTSTGVNHGVYGQTESSEGYGVVGIYTGTSSPSGDAAAVYGESRSVTNPRAIVGRTISDSGGGAAITASCGSAFGSDFLASGAGTDYNSSSSRRWKKNVVPIADPLGKIARLRGVSFDWDHEHGGRHDVGMIAEEVGAVLPEIVQFESNGVDAVGMDYSRTTPLLVEAVNALRAEKDAEIDELRQRIVELERLLRQVAPVAKEEVQP